jgi:ATP-dependent Clp protease ATP-binding subunit ClpA
VIGYREFDLIDEAMLAVRSKYSSAVPALKWILSEYDRLKRERYEATREQSRAEEEQSVAETMREVAADRGRCMAYLRRQATEQLAHAADGVRRQYGWAVPTTTNDDIETWGWAMRYAVAFALADAERGAA